MKVKAEKTKPLFDLHLEYSEKAAAREKDYRSLESRFQFHFGFLPVRVEDDSFMFLSEKQQDASKAFWTNLRVITCRNSMQSARILSEMYFNAYADSGRGQ